MIKSFAAKIDYKVPQELQQYVIAIIQGESESIIDVTYPVFPTGFPLMINIYNDIPTLHINNQIIHPNSRLQVAGQIYNAEVKIEIKGVFGQIGLVLYPSAPYYLFHKMGDSFLNRWCDLEKTSPICIKELHSNLSDCQIPIDRVSILLEFIKLLHNNRLPEIEWLDKALLKIYSLGGKISQENLADHSKVSLRHFRRKFKEVIGVSPKYFCKVIQLNAVFELLSVNDTEKLHHLAIDCGYYDQAHFINDFKKLIGESPVNFLNGKHSYVKTYLGRAGV